MTACLGIDEFQKETLLIFFECLVFRYLFPWTNSEKCFTSHPTLFSEGSVPFCEYTYYLSMEEAFLRPVCVDFLGTRNYTLYYGIGRYVSVTMLLTLLTYLQRSKQISFY